MTRAGLDPGKDVQLVQQQFDMQALLQGDIDAAQAMSYNEYAQLLEAENPETGEPYEPEDFTVLDWNEVGTAMLQDAIWASTERLEDKTYQDTTVKFLKGSMRGWIYCRDNAEDCRDMVVAKGSKLGASHQLWQTVESSKLVWPAPEGIGHIDEAAWDRTVELSLETRNADGQTILTKEPEGLAYTNDYVEKVLAELSGEDTKGESYKPEAVTLNPGGG
jgi:NitT/TauT family transport system substrate-binding protein